ncbi:vascular endothelial growth factor B isoform X2 [Sceloporus undulatus]|nr:vascular endothelial growth factor B isoform X2 [Sceloporus undulatus]
MLLQPTNKTHSSEEVVRFLDVYNRSSCQPKETMVSVMSEHPYMVNHIVMPSCVALKRCAGCCADESLECMPTQTRELVMEVMLTLFPHFHLNQLTFLEHTQCTCRSKKTFYRLNGIRPVCTPCLDRKRWLDPRTCKCVCRRDSKHCEARGLKFNKATCRCVNLHRRSSNRRAKTAL